MADALKLNVSFHDVFVHYMPKFDCTLEEVRDWLETWYTGHQFKHSKLPRGLEFTKFQLDGKEIRKLTLHSLESYLRKCGFNDFDAAGIAKDVERAKQHEVCLLVYM
jgi:hypothetical protein